MAYFIVFENITPTSESDPFFVGCLSGTTMFQLQKTSLEHSHGHHGLAVGPVGPVGPVGHRSTQMGRTSMRSFCFCSSKLLFASSSKASGRGPTEFQRILDVEQGWHGEKKNIKWLQGICPSSSFFTKENRNGYLVNGCQWQKGLPKNLRPHTCAMATALAPWRREHPGYRTNAEVLRLAEPTP